MKNLFSNNPFRVLGVSSNSGIRLIEKNVSKFNAYSKIGRKISTDYDFSFFNLATVNREISNITKAQNSLLIDNNKLKFSLYWFIDENPFDSIALKSLIKGDVEKALDVWVKSTRNKKLTKNNFSNYLNLSSLLLIKNLDSSKNDKFNKTDQAILDLKEAIKIKYEIIDSTFIVEFKNKIAPKNTLNLKEFFSNSISEALNVNFKNSELILLFKGLNKDIYNSLSSNLTKEPINNIQTKINSTLEKINDYKKNPETSIHHPDGDKLGVELIKSTLNDLKLLKEIIEPADFQFQIISDNLANAIIDCGVAYWNEYVDSQTDHSRKSYQDYSRSFKYALSISVNEKPKNRANSSIKHVEEQINSNVCKFCNTNDISSYSSIKVKMHKMKWDNSYTYFKNGGIKIACCKSCRSSKSSDSTKAFFAGFAVWAAISAISVGWFLGIDLIFAQLSMSKWIFRKFKTTMYYDKLSSHPDIKPLLYEGYSYGMP